MKARDIAVLNYINREGLDNSQWGFYTNTDESTVYELFGARSADKCPEQFMYVWVNPEDAREMLSKLDKLGVTVDRRYETYEGDSTLLIWDLSEVS